MSRTERHSFLGFCKPSSELNSLLSHCRTLIHLVVCLDSLKLRDKMCKKILLYMSLYINWCQIASHFSIDNSIIFLVIQFALINIWRHWFSFALYPYENNWAGCNCDLSLKSTSSKHSVYFRLLFNTGRCFWLVSMFYKPQSRSCSYFCYIYVLKWV